MRNLIDLIGDGIEDPWNAKAMIDIAGVFGASCYFRDRKNLVESFNELGHDAIPLQLISCDQITQLYSPVVNWKIWITLLIYMGSSFHLGNEQRL